MARPKGSKNKKVEEKIVEEVVLEPSEVEVEVVKEVVPTLIAFLSVDYPNEGLNDMARKVNEIISVLNK